MALIASAFAAALLRVVAPTCTPLIRISSVRANVAELTAKPFVIPAHITAAS